MSKKAIAQLYKNENLKEELMAVYGYQEIVKLGCKHGYRFTIEDFKAVMQAVDDFHSKQNNKEIINTNTSQNYQQEIKSISQQKITSKYPVYSYKQASSIIYCHEFNLHEIQGFESISSEFETIKIKPDTVDMNIFQKAFSTDDFKFASISPASIEFSAQYNEIMRQANSIDAEYPEFQHLCRRNFHLIDLNRHVEHKLYEDYFHAKVRIIRILKNFFGTDVRFTGSLWYPPNAYRTWHTNENAVGWRMYLIDFDQPELTADGQSFFRYMHPETKELITLVDKPKLVRFFKIENQPEQLFWHCIVNATKANRWSYGFNVPDNWMDKIK